MTGEQMFSKAIGLLGYERKARISDNALLIINQVYSDLKYASGGSFEALGSMNGEINLPSRVLDDVMPYGVAAFIAQREGDGDNQQYFATLYNQKRRALTRLDKRSDSMPYPW